MCNRVSWVNRTLIGAGLLLPCLILALPGTKAHPPVALPEFAPEVVVEKAWFGRLGGEGIWDLGAYGERWVLRAPLSLTEYSDGTARLTGVFEDPRRIARVWQLDIEFGGSNAADGGPRGYRNVEGHLRGHGELDGALVRLTGGDSPGLLTANEPGFDPFGRLSFLSETIVAPAGDAGFPPGGDSASCVIEFTESTHWGVRALDLALAGFPQGLHHMAGGELTEHADGSARFESIVAVAGDRERAFTLELDLAQASNEGGWTYPSSRHLHSNTFVGDGGAIDPKLWRTYSEVSGRLVGIGEFGGAEIALELNTGAFQLGLGAHGGPSSYGAHVELSSRIVAPPSHGTEFPGATGAAQLRFDLATSSVHFARSVEVPSPSGSDENSVLELYGLGADFQFESGGDFCEESDGTARLTGLVSRQSDPSCCFLVDATFAQRAPNEHAYGRWTGQLHGLRDREGEHFTITGDGEGLRVGHHASGEELVYGAWGQFHVTQDSPGFDQGIEGGALHFGLAGRRQDSVTTVSSDRDTGALRLPGLGRDFDFVSGGVLRHEADGTAHLSGVLARRSFGRQRFYMDATLAGRIDPATPGHPGSADHFAGGTAAVHYRGLQGRLVGLDDYAGALLELELRGRSVRYGAGTSGADEGYGVSAWLSVDVREQPQGALSIDQDLKRGELVFGVSNDLVGQAQPALAIPAVASASGHALYLPGIGDDFVFQDGGSIHQYSDGSAVLAGVLVRRSEPRTRFQARIEFSGRCDTPSVGRIERDLPASCYVERGGVVDTETWHFYKRSAGILVGLGDLAGAMIELEHEGLALQVGFGANGRNLQYGASGNLSVELRNQPTTGAELPTCYPGGEIHIDLASPGS